MLILPILSLVFTKGTPPDDSSMICHLLTGIRSGKYLAGVAIFTIIASIRQNLIHNFSAIVMRKDTSSSHVVKDVLECVLFYLTRLADHLLSDFGRR